MCGDYAATVACSVAAAVAPIAPVAMHSSLLRLQSASTQGVLVSVGHGQVDDATPAAARLQHFRCHAARARLNPAGLASRVALTPQDPRSPSAKRGGTIATPIAATTTCTNSSSRSMPSVVLVSPSLGPEPCQ